MTLSQVGFYTLSDRRAQTASSTSRLMRCEVLLTGRCNFKCPYCRGIGGADLPTERVLQMLDRWAQDRLFAVRFSGGEPTLHPGLEQMIAHARKLGVERIAISTNGSAARSLYERLIAAGLNDASVSLDACCAEDGDKMAGGVKGAWLKVVKTIEWLSCCIYTTVGIVLTPDNVKSVNETIRFAAGLGVHDIRVIPAAQVDDQLRDVRVDVDLLDRFPILRYRIENMQAGRKVRGLGQYGLWSNRCGLVVDDMAVMGDQHYPCIIYLREGGASIGTLGPGDRQARAAWAASHDTSVDPICRKNCLDVCVLHNAVYAEAHEKTSCQA